MSVHFDASALIELGARLARVSAETQPMAEMAVAKSAHDLEAHAKGLAAVDTGTMRNSVGTDMAGLRATVGPTVNYAVFVEHGTYKMSPQPFMGPAADAVEPGFIAAMKQLGGTIL